MAGALAGQTITVTAKKSMTVDEIVEVVRSAFGATGCRTCTSGGVFILREEVELPIAQAANARVVIG